MTTPVYSVRFTCQRGLAGTSGPFVVPAGHTWVLVQLTSYASPVAGAVTTFFKDAATGAAMFAAFHEQFHQSWFGFNGRLVLEQGDGFEIEVDVTLADAADVQVSGYDLTN